MNIVKKTVVITLVFGLCLPFLLSCASEQKQNAKLTSYNITVDYDDVTQTAACTCDVDFFNCYELPFAEIPLHLFANAFSTTEAVTERERKYAFYDGESTGGVTVLQVKVGDKAVDCELTGNDQILLVPLHVELFPEERVKISVAYTLSLPKIIARYGVNPYEVVFSGFYPVVCWFNGREWLENGYSAFGDPFVSECANYKATLTFSEKFCLSSTGRVLSEKVENSKKSVSLSAEKVRDFAFSLSEKFKTVSALSGSTLITYSYLTDEDPERTLRIAQNAMNVFSSAFGTYPYTTFNVAETPLLQAGMEYPCFVLLSTGLSPEEREDALVHEIAHQWWFGLVGNDAFSHAFMDEGLAEFSLYVYKKQVYGNETAKKFFEDQEKSYILFQNVMASVTGKFKSTMARKLTDFLSEYEYRYIAYVKGFLLFKNLSDLVGYHRFIDGLKCYVENMKYKTARLDDMVGYIERGAKRQIDGIVDAWVQGRVVFYVP